MGINRRLHQACLRRRSLVSRTALCHRGTPAHEDAQCRCSGRWSSEDTLYPPMLSDWESSDSRLRRVDPNMQSSGQACIIGASMTTDPMKLPSGRESRFPPSWRAPHGHVGTDTGGCWGFHPSIASCGRLQQQPAGFGIGTDGDSTSVSTQLCDIRYATPQSPDQTHTVPIAYVMGLKQPLS